MSRKKLIGVLIVVGISVSWVSATQFAQSTFSPEFNAPYFTTWFISCWGLLNFPLYMLPAVIRGHNIKDLIRSVFMLDLYTLTRTPWEGCLGYN